MAGTKLETAGSDQLPRKVVFLLVPDFSMMAFMSAIEPLRGANRMARAPRYEWRIVSLDGARVRASNGIALDVEGDMQGAEPCDMLVVCAGLHPERQVSSALIAVIKRWRKTARQIGGICTGSHILARAGLLDGYRCTIHWEDISSFAETFPDIAISSRLFEIDRDRFSCSGGVAPLDMMVNFIARDYGRSLATQVSELLLHPQAREASAPQRIGLSYRTGVYHPKLLAVIGAMEDSIEAPRPLGELADEAQLSGRQMERLFQSHFGQTPQRYYMDLRLYRARHLLRHTAMPIVEVALAAGFGSSAHFAKTYRGAFGHTPRDERALGGPLPT